MISLKTSNSDTNRKYGKHLAAMMACSSCPEQMSVVM